MATGGTDALQDLQDRLTRSEQIIDDLLARLRLADSARMSDFGQARPRPAFAGGVRRFKFTIRR